VKISMRLYFCDGNYDSLHHLHISELSRNDGLRIAAARSVGIATEPAVDSEWTIAELVEVFSVDKAKLLELVRGAGK
jgi:hypothetical protein